MNMKTIITAAAAALFAANVSAVEIYQGLDEGNTALATPRVSASDFTGVQPSIGDSVDRYHGFAEGNTDLFKGDGSQERPGTGRPDIYMDVSKNPDLAF
jgi:hypothetical protein